MDIITRGNVKIWRFNNNANQTAAIITHGGYTPKRGFFQTGSGKTIVPNGITLNFYTQAETVCVGTQAYWLISTGVSSNPVAETLTGNDITENYSLTYDDKLNSWAFNDAWQMDVITVRPDKEKAHLSDIWNVIGALRLPYTVLHAYFCRINKLTYNF